MAGFIAQATTELNNDCEAECVAFVGGPCDHNCFCWADLYDWERRHCGESHPMISCLGGF
jgi:hypothetical protein